MKKRGQHYVWRYYLTSWTDSSGKLFCLRDNAVFAANPRKIGKARDFYKLVELSPTEIAFLESFIMDYWTEEIQQINRNWITMFTMVFRIKKQMEQAGKWDNEKESELDIFMTNLVEDFHNKVEDAALPYLDSLKNGNIGTLRSSEGKIGFMFFLCLQYLRTNMMKNNVVKAVASGQRPMPPAFVQNVWSVLYFILATNMAFSLSSFSSTYRAVILRNNSPVSFMTGDQPVINTLADYSNYEEAKEFELYYPLSPTLALLISESDNYKGHQSVFDVQENDVRMYNDLIFQASHEQIYASDLSILQGFIK